MHCDEPCKFGERVKGIASGGLDELVTLGQNQAIRHMEDAYMAYFC